MSDPAVPVASGIKEGVRTTSPKRALAYAVLAAAVLVFAASIQFLAVLIDSDLLGNPIVNSLLVGVLLIIAVKLPPFTRLPGEPSRRVLRMIGILIPVVDRYVTIKEREAAEQAQRAARMRINTSRIANLQQVVVLNALAEIPKDRVGELSATDDRELGVSEMIASEVDTVFSKTVWNRSTPPSITLQRQVLEVLHRDATRGQNGQPWTQRLKNALIDPLTDVLMESPRVLRTAATRSQVVDELKALQLDFTIDRLLDRLSLVPTDAMARMQRVFERYSILDLAGVSWADSDWSNIQTTAIAMGGNQAKRFANICAEELAETKRPLSSHLLRLLYFEAFSPPTDGYWKKHKNALLDELSELIEDSHALPDFVAPDFQQASTLRTLLDAHLSYSLPLLRGEVAALDRLRRVLDDYRRFLLGHRLASTSPTMSADEIAELIAKHVHGGLPQGERGVWRIGLAESEIALLYGYGTEMVESMHDDIEAAAWSMQYGRSPLPTGTAVPTSFHEAVSLVALHLHACEGQRATSDARVALAQLARRHGTDEAKLVLAAHSIVVGDSPGETIHLHDVLTRWADVLDGAQAAEPAELERRISSAGHRLVTSSGAEHPAPGEPATPAPGPGVEDQLIDVRNTLGGVEQLLQDHAWTSGPAEDEWLVRPYLITYDNLAGPLTDLLDSLAWPDSRQRATLAELDIRWHVGEQPKYRFANFTRQARLGFLPRNMPFDEFLAEFEHDLGLVLLHRDEVLGYQFALPGTASTLTVDGLRPLTIASPPTHGSCAIHPASGEIEYTPTPVDYRGPDQLVVDDDAGERHIVRLAVRPDLRQVEVTVSRIHLAQFAELVVDHHKRTIGRTPSVENVIVKLEERGQLDPIENSIIRRHLGQIVRS